MGEKHKELNCVLKGSAGYSFSSFYECLFDAVLAFLLVTCKFSRCVVSASLDHKEEEKKRDFKFHCFGWVDSDNVDMDM